MADREKQIRLFERASKQRLTAAGILLDNGIYLEAVYLAGYAVECALKALLLRWTPRRQHAATLKKLTQVGAKGHDFEYLKRLLKEQRRAQDRKDPEILGALVTHLQVVASWSTELRYQVGALDPEESEQFFEAAKAIHDTCTRR
jgi:HEPN domain-containing protein